jgi:hypothetical protein
LFIKKSWFGRAGTVGVGAGAEVVTNFFFFFFYGSVASLKWLPV